MPLAGVNAKETLKRKNAPAVPCRLPAERPHYVQKALHRPYIKHCLDSSNEVHKNITLNIYSVMSWRQVTLISKCQKRYHSTSESLPAEEHPGPQKSSGRRAKSISPSGQMNPLQQGKTTPCFPVIEMGSPSQCHRAEGVTQEVQLAHSSARHRSQLALL